MYMGVILRPAPAGEQTGGAPHVYGGDPGGWGRPITFGRVLPMYMGVIP